MSDGVKKLLDALEEQKNNESFSQVDEFNKHLEIVIMATRQSGAGAVVCRDALLSLYDGSNYRVNLSELGRLDDSLHKSLMFVIGHHTSYTRKDIHEYMPSFKPDFERMQAEVA